MMRYYLTHTEARQTNVIRNMDALRYLQSLPSDFVDLVFADPPYNLGYRYDAHKDNMPEWEYYRWSFSWLDECRRVLKPTGSLFVLNIPYHAISLAAHLKQSMVFQHWIAWKAGSRGSNKAVMPEHYALLWFTKTEQFTANETRRKHDRCRSCGEMAADYGGKKHLIHPYGPMVSDVWTDIGRSKHKQRGQHPCKLPPRLVSRVIALASNPGDIVLDPFMGTGTTAIEARRTGRRWTGCEISQTYIDMANNALNIPIQTRMFTQQSLVVA